MRHVVWVLALLAACSVPPVTTVTSADAQSDTDAPNVEGAAGGADAGDAGLGASKLTGLPGIDRAQDLVARIIDARGTGRLGGVPIAAGTNTALTAGQWMLTDPGSEYEITVRNALVPDGIVRLEAGAAFLIEPVRLAPRFQLYGGRAAFYLPHITLDEVVVMTPAGPLVTRGGAFTVTVSTDLQVLVTCRQGSVFLTGNQNAAAVPGQVLVADRLGRGRTYSMTPSEATVFSDHWMKIAAEEAAPILAAELPRNVAAWNRAHVRDDSEQARFLAFWFRTARSMLGARVPGPEVWSDALTAPSSTLWPTIPEGPGLLGELP